MSFIIAVGLLACAVILFIIVLKCCIRRYENTNFQTQQSTTTLSTHLPYNPDPLQSSNYFPSVPNSQVYNTRPTTFTQPIQSGAIPATMMGFGINHPATHGGGGSLRHYTQWPNQNLIGVGGIQSPINPNIQQHAVPDLPPSYVVASELLDPPPSYIEALTSPR